MTTQKDFPFVDFRPIELINFDKILSARKAIAACEMEIE